MAWIGEHFSSITEKISDFTKVLNEDRNDVTKKDQQDEFSFLSHDELLDLCRKYDSKLRLLIAEKESLEQGIEELDQQHQEAINELLSMKNQILTENNDLRIKLGEQEKNSQMNKKNQINFELLSNFFNDEDAKLLENKNCSFGDQINLISILHSLKNCSDENLLKNQKSWLENQRHLLKNKLIYNDDISIDNIITRINNYIDCLDIISKNDHTLLPVINEAGSLIDLLLKENVKLKENIKLFENKTQDSKPENIVNNDAASQTEAKIGINNNKKDFSIQVEYSVISHSKQLQTENFKCEKCVKLDECYDTIAMLQSNINSFKEKNVLLEKELLEIKNLPCSVSSILTQTDECLLCNQCTSYEKEINSYKQNIEEKNRKITQLLNDIDKIKSETKEKSNNAKTLEEKEILNLKEKIATLTSEIAYLHKEKQEKDNSPELNNVHSPLYLCNKCKKVLDEEMILNQVSYLPDNEKALLEEKLKTLDYEKNKLLCVLNEKTQECSSLKAEVHKLTYIVASEKQALLKLQQDNCELNQSNKDNSNPELTKEAIQKLSHLVREKDLEIEALKQKNDTLTLLFQQNTSLPDHLQTLIEERESLTKEVNKFKADREKIMVTYNAKDQECRQKATEIKKLNSLLAKQLEKFDILQQQHLSIAQQYEEKQKSLINTQNEMIALKQRVSDLEQQQIDINEKYNELLNKINSDVMIQVTKEELNSKISEIEQLKQSNDEKDHLMQEKDCMIHDLTQQIKKIKHDLDHQEQTSVSYKRETCELMNNLKELENKFNQIQSEKEMMEQKLKDKHSELVLIKEMNERLNMALKEKEFAIHSMTEKISSLSHYITRDNNSNQAIDINQILAESESMFSKAQDLYREKDEALLSLSQSQHENQSLRNEIQRMISNELHLKNELDRLRQHLIQIEENYTSDALKAEEREKELRDELAEVERRAKISSTAVVDTNQRASVQIASLQEQLSMIANQRDQALAQVSLLDDKVQHCTASITNLQLAHEQMQRSNEKKIKDVEKKWIVKLEKEKETITHLEKELKRKELQLEESSQALEAATRLSEQLDAKEAIIRNLKEELSRAENVIKTTQKEIDSLQSNTEGKVDRVVMKSLVLGYFSTPPGQKSEVIRLLARVLDFNQEEMEKAGIVLQRNQGRKEQRGILSSIFNRLPSIATDNQRAYTRPEKSFTTLFVQFLENESQPLVPMPFPAEKMANELTSKIHIKKSQSSENKDSTNNSLLLNIDSAFPTFTPIPALEYSSSPAPAILKEVLK